MVEIEGSLKWGEGFGDEWWPRKEDPRFDDIGSHCVRGGDGGDVGKVRLLWERLQGCCCGGILSLMPREGGDAVGADSGMS